MMISKSESGREPHQAVHDAIVALARAASIEMNVQDAPALQSVARFLAQGKKIYVSHLPKQTWQQTSQACDAVATAGFRPVPHLPARLVPGERELDRIVASFAAAGAKEVLLIAGDYPQPAGAFADTLAALAAGVLTKHGIQALSVAGHPEGLPHLSSDVLLEAALAKQAMARDQGLALTFLTQFLFEAEPFLQWARKMRAHGLQARIVAGLAGPARVSTLFKYAVRCGVGPSIRALGARPGTLLRLAGERGPEALIRSLAAADGRLFDGIHLFCFGGFVRTCEWLTSLARGKFDPDRAPFV